MYPGFDGAKPMVEQIGALENLVRDYELSAGKTYDRDLLMGVLLRCAPKTIREHLTVSLPSSANYGSVKQAILNYEKASKTWDYNTVLKQNALPSATTSGGAASSDQGPAPMELDQVTSGKDHKGKGHEGGKGKGYWGTWSSYAAGKAFGRGYGRGKGHKGHGKSKGKKFGNKGGKKGSKGKGGKSGGKKGGKDKGGKARLGRDVCRFCKQSGHWGNECPNRRNVREVSGSEVTTQAPSESTATLTMTPSQSASQYRVRRVGEMMRPSFYHMPVTPPSELEIHYVGSDEEDDQESLEGWYIRRICVYCINVSHAEGSEEHAESSRGHYVIGEDDSDEEVQDWKSDPLYEWYVKMDQEDELMSVRVVQALDARLHSVILDSGADVSLLPQGLAECGYEVKPPRTLRIHDAQGGTMRVQGMRRAQLYFADSGCVIEEDFILSDSSHVLLSLGRLMRNGWKFQSQGTWGSWEPSGGNNNNGKAGGLISPDGKAVIPVEFHKNSLMVTAEVRSIQKVREVMVKLLFSWERLIKNQWNFLENGTPVLVCQSTEFQDLPTKEWKYRTTIAHMGGSDWEVIEASEKVSDEFKMTGLLFATTMITFAHRKVESLDQCLCEELKGEAEVKPSEDEEMEEEIQNEEELLEPFREAEPNVPRKLDIQVPKGIVRSEGVAGGHSNMEYEAGMTLTVDGETISEQSTIYKLREVCVKLGLSPSGGKKKLFLKIFHFMKDSKEDEVTEIAERLAKPKRGVKVRPGCEEPIKEEIEEHMATHLPMKPWCEFCLAAKSKQDHAPTHGDVKYEDPGEPCVQMDYMFVGQPCATLVILDSWTRYAQALPLQGKTVSKKLAEAVVKFSLHLNYVQENVHFAMDVEPATKALLDMVVAIRRKMGYKATVREGKPYHKGRTARVERRIQNLRRQCLTLVEMVESKIEERIPEDHVLRAWAIHHASWLYNRYRLRGETQSTAHQLAFGRPYTGRILPFGEYVFGLMRPDGVKNRSLWTGGTWVGKDVKDMEIIATKEAVFTSRSVRRTQPAWRKDEVLALTGSPWSSKGPKVKAGHLAPLPRIREEPPQVENGNQQDELQDEAATDPDSSKHDTLSDLLMDASSTRSSSKEPSAPSERKEASKRDQEGDVEDRPAKESKMDADAPIEEPVRKAIRSDSGSGPPSPSASLFPPKFAGKVSQEDQDYQDDDEGYHEDELWEDPILKEEDWMEEEDEDIGDEEDMPPKVSEEELEERDQVAAKDELSKLRSMQVVKEVRKQECDQSGKFLTLTTVFDWRKRDSEWKRRCRIVCREFRAGAASNEETFSPTTGHAAVRMVIALHLIFGWELTSLDIKDAFLQVSQKVLMYAEISPWIKRLLGLDEDCVWKVEKCLPGQRAAAEQWFSHLVQSLKGWDLKPSKAFPRCSGTK